MGAVRVGRFPGRSTSRHTSMKARFVVDLSSLEQRRAEEELCWHRTVRSGHSLEAEARECLRSRRRTAWTA